MVRLQNNFKVERKIQNITTTKMTHSHNWITIIEKINNKTHIGNTLPNIINSNNTITTKIFTHYKNVNYTTN